MFNNIKKSVRKYFGFSESETNGFLIFIPVLILLLFAPSMLKRYLVSKSKIISDQYEEEIKEWIAELESNISVKDTAEYCQQPFDFDPNLTTVEELKNLGFKDAVAQRISNYRSKGGRFYSKDDLLKIYGISEENTKRLWEHIKIKPIAKAKRKYDTKAYNKTPKKKETVPIEPKDINSCGAEDLVAIRGIGPVLSERIIKFRDNLGGFNHITQLQEVYGLSDEVIVKLQKQFFADSLKVSKVDINSDSLKVLARHPYVSYSLAKVILAYKQQHGQYQSIDELKNIKVMNDSLFLKLSPYIIARHTDLIE
ncbi:MAG: helix-hairpin-helix domain-containing protein [Cyclobacteriaceae bacterium]